MSNYNNSFSQDASRNPFDGDWCGTGRSQPKPVAASSSGNEVPLNTGPAKEELPELDFVPVEREVSESKRRSFGGGWTGEEEDCFDQIETVHLLIDSNSLEVDIGAATTLGELLSCVCIKLHASMLLSDEIHVFVASKGRLIRTTLVAKLVPGRIFHINTEKK